MIAQDNIVFVSTAITNNWTYSLGDLGAQFYVLPQGPVKTCYATESSIVIGQFQTPM